jgi:hypothetical protein
MIYSVISLPFATMNNTAENTLLLQISPFISIGKILRNEVPVEGICIFKSICNMNLPFHIFYIYIIFNKWVHAKQEKIWKNTCFILRILVIWRKWRGRPHKQVGGGHRNKEKTVKIPWLKLLILTQIYTNEKCKQNVENIIYIIYILFTQ